MNFQAQLFGWLLFGSVIFVYLRLRMPCGAGGQSAKKLEILKVEENEKKEV